MILFGLHSTALPTPEAAFGLLAAAERSALILPLAATGILVALVAAYFTVRRALSGSSYRLRDLSPEKIAAHRTRDDEEPSIHGLSESIIERATEIKKALDDSPSEIQVEMCAIGYRKCANDMITLTHLVNEELKEAGLLRRWRLNRSRKRAIESLSAVRESLPPGALKATRQEK